MDDFLSGLGDTLKSSGTQILNAATSAEIARINAKSLRPAAPGGVYVQAAPQLTTADKASEVLRSPALWAVVVLLVIGGIVLVVRR